MPTEGKSQESVQGMKKLKQTSDSKTFYFLTEKPDSYKVAPDGTVPSFTQDLDAKKTGGLTWSEYP